MCLVSHNQQLVCGCPTSDLKKGTCMQNLAVGKLPLKERSFIDNPGTTETLHISLLKPEAHQQLVQYAKVGVRL